MGETAPVGRTQMERRNPAEKALLRASAQVIVERGIDRLTLASADGHTRS